MNNKLKKQQTAYLKKRSTLEIIIYYSIIADNERRVLNYFSFKMEEEVDASFELLPQALE